MKNNLQKGGTADVVIFVVVVLFLLIVFGIDIIDYIHRFFIWLAGLIKGL